MNIKNTGTPIIPIIVKSEVKALEISKLLFKKGLLVSAIRPPTVPINTARLRLAFNAGHTKKQIDKLIVNLKIFLARYEN